MADWRQQRAFLDFFERHSVTHVNLATLGRARADGKRVMKGDARARDRAETEKSLGWAWYENQRGGAEVYVRPARWMPDGTLASWPLIFLDDVNPDQAAKIAAQFSAMVIETSPNRCHVWLAVSRPLDEDERKALQRHLIAEHGGDGGSVSGEHFGRLAGFKNHKRGGCWVNIKTIGTGLLYPVPADVDVDVEAPFARPHSSDTRAARASPGLYSSESSESEREFGYIIGRLRWLSRNAPERMQEEAERLKAELIERARARGKRDPQQYAERTIVAATARLN